MLKVVKSTNKIIQNTLKSFQVRKSSCSNEINVLISEIPKETDVMIKDILRDKLKSKKTTLADIKKLIQDNKDKLSQINEGILIIENFLELYQSLPSLLAKVKELPGKYYIAQKFFLNLFVDKKKATNYKLNPPFNKFL